MASPPSACITATSVSTRPRSCTGTKPRRVIALDNSREDLRLAIVTWIETKYNRRRRQRALGKLTPIEFEMIYAAADAA